MTDNKDDNSAVINKILQDPIFSSSGPYKTILEYLYNCYQNNIEPTEIDIAQNVFGKKNDFNPNEDTVVRVNLYRLRKKLDEYYNSTGKNDVLRLLLPKGHHVIKFVKNKSINKSWKKYIRPKYFGFLISYLFLLIIIVLLWFQNNSHQLSSSHSNIDTQNNILWSDFVNSELNTSIVIGEIFSFYLNRPKYNREWLIRDDQINTYEELRSFIQQTDFEESNFYLPGWDIIPKSAAYNLLRMSPIISDISDRVDLKITSDVTLDNIRDDNIIYMGHFHNLKHLKKYLPGSRFHPSTIYSSSKLHPERYIGVTAEGIDTLYQIIFQYDQKSALNSDYVLISKIPGPTNNIFLFIISFQSMGRMEAIKMFTQEKLYAHLMTEIQLITENITPFFELLIEVKGYEETGFETRIKHFFPYP